MLSQDFRLEGNGFLINHLGRREIRHGFQRGQLAQRGADDGKAFGGGQFQKLAQREQRELVGIISLRSCQARLLQGSLLLREFHPTGFAVLEQSLQANHLHGVDADLTMRHVGHLRVVENLYIGLGHLHTDVVAGFLQILNGSIQVQLVQLDGIRNIKTREERNTGTQAERGVVGVAVGVGSVDGLRTTEVERLTADTDVRGRRAAGRQAEVRQTTITCC